MGNRKYWNYECNGCQGGAEWEFWERLPFILLNILRRCLATKILSLTLWHDTENLQYLL